MAAANLTAGKPWSPKNEIRSQDVLPLAANVVLYPGAHVGWDTSGAASKGFVVKYDQTSANASIVYLGRYNPTIGASAVADSTGLANGAINVEIEFHRAKYLVWWDNTSTHPCAAADRGSKAYAESDHEAGNTAGSLSSVGIIYKIGSAGEGSGGMVLVDITGNI